MRKSRLWQQAASMSARAHRHQIRKDGRTPYVAHPVRVALTVLTVFKCDDDETLAAALLHDVIEDTGADYDDILERFGAAVADIVACLSKDMRLVESEREVDYDRQLAAGPWQAQLIKLADVYDNFHDAPLAADQAKLADRARRALAVAGNESQLDGAKAVVSEMIARFEAG